MDFFTSTAGTLTSIESPRRMLVKIPPWEMGSALDAMEGLAVGRLGLARCPGRPLERIFFLFLALGPRDILSGPAAVVDFSLRMGITGFSRYRTRIDFLITASSLLWVARHSLLGGFSLEGIHSPGR